ncbi:MAG: hypothetical protein AAFQ89_18800, partial [Cyanobacteria bacterium J06626_18]
ELVEPLGREILVRGQIAPQKQGDAPQALNFFVQPPKLPKLGEIIRLRFDPHHLFLFDPVSGQTLYPASSEAAWG